MNTKLLPLALATLLSATTAQAGDHWVADYDEAVKIARAEGKHLFVDFTGSDWCGWCIKLHEEVFDHDEFLTPMTKDYVLVSLDFPNGAAAKSRVPNPERNQVLKAQHAITGFPTVLLMTPDGEVYGRTGYQAGGPEAYVGNVNKIRAKGMASLTAVQQALKAFKNAKGEGRPKALLAVVDLLGEQGPQSAFAGSLTTPIKAHWKILPIKAQGRAIDLLNQAGQADSGTLQGARAIDPKNESGLYARSVLAIMEGVAEEAAIAPALEQLDSLLQVAHDIDAETAESLYVLGAYWNSEFADNLERAKFYAVRGLKVTSEPRYKQLFNDILERE